MTLLSYLSVFQVSGADAGTFLHAQLAASTTGLKTGECTFAAYCNAKGQVIALLLVCRSGDDWLISIESSLAEPVMERLRKYVLRADVKIRLPEELKALGQDAGAAGETGATFFVPPGFPFAYHFAQSAENPPASISAWRYRELAHGVSWLQQETSERFLPQMLGLDALGAVSFNKGCYPGQEIIARTRYLGKLKRRPVLIEVDGLPDFAAGDDCYLNSGIQRVDSILVDGTHSIDPDGNERTILLLVAPLDSAEPVSGISLGQKTLPARRSLPAQR